MKNDNENENYKERENLINLNRKIETEIKRKLKEN
jgi:hypothetical protein